VAYKNIRQKGKARQKKLKARRLCRQKVTKARQSEQIITTNSNGTTKYKTLNFWAAPI
jgi:hypothetical protein